ncbi:MAG TPA: PqqD family protein [Candidatus Cybelea sp.]|nr:PqqD family protein [Candidatus Cybelea sp.]
MTTYRRRADVSETPVEDDLYLVVPETQDIHHLDPIAAGVWRLLAEPASAAAISDVLAAAFPDQPPASIAADVEEALRRLSEAGLIASG